MFDLGRS